MSSPSLDPLIKWVLGTIAGSLFFAVAVKYIYEPIRDYIKSFTITLQLLKETRPTRNALKGKHLADRLFDIWNNGNPLPLRSRKV